MDSLRLPSRNAEGSLKPPASVEGAVVVDWAGVGVEGWSEGAAGAAAGGAAAAGADGVEVEAVAGVAGLLAFGAEAALGCLTSTQA